MPQFVRVRSQFVGWHKWKDAPEDVVFLRDFHRHVFKVELVVQVKHGDREVEFFTLQKQLDGFLARNYAGRKFLESCEQIAENIGVNFLHSHEVTVSEDGENDGIWIPEMMPQPHQRILVMENQVPVWQVKDDPEADKKPDLLTEVKTRVFVGIEAEGPRRGTLTVFVPGSTEPRDFTTAMNVLDEKRFPYQQIYYGAGNDRKVRSDTLAAIINQTNPKETYKLRSVLCMECVSWGAFDHVISSGPMKGLPFPQDILVVSLSDEDMPIYGNYWTKKIDGSSITWISQSGLSLTTKTDDPLFQFDKYVDQL